MNISEIYWLAGLYEGEGWCRFSLSKNGQCRTFVFGIAMTDFDVLQHAYNLTGGHLYTTPKEKMRSGNLVSTKDMHTLVIYGSRGVSVVLTLYCLLGERRRGQIRKALTEWAKYPAYANHGSRHHLAKLNDQKVRRIRILYKQGVTQYELASKFGVHVSTIAKAIHRGKWKHVV